MTIDRRRRQHGASKGINTGAWDLFVWHRHWRREGTGGEGSRRGCVRSVEPAKDQAAIAGMVLVHSRLVERVGRQSDRIRHRASEMGRVVVDGVEGWPHVVERRGRQSRRRERDCGRWAWGVF